MKLRTMALFLTGLALFLLAPAAHASGRSAVGPHLYPAGTCSTVSVSTQNPNPGETIQVAGSAFEPNATVKLELGKSTSGSGTTYDVGSFTTDSTGAFAGSITIPSSLTNGGHYVLYASSGADTTGQCPADPFIALEVGAASVSGGTTGSSTGSTTGGTANTGFDIAAALVVAAGLVGTGVFLNRRGRKARAGV